MLSDSPNVRPVNELKNNGFFWITSHTKATKEQVDEELSIIKLFVSNYARDLLNGIGIEHSFLNKEQYII